MDKSRKIFIVLLHMNDGFALQGLKSDDSLKI